MRCPVCGVCYIIFKSTELFRVVLHTFEASHTSRGAFPSSSVYSHEGGISVPFLASVAPGATSDSCRILKG